MAIIKINDLDLLAQKLAEKNTVVIPFENKDGECVFKPLEKGDKIKFGYFTTALPIKQFFLPGKERVFTYDIQKKKVSHSPTVKNTIIFGLNLRDTEALAQLDEIMAKPHEDHFYFQKRAKTTIISIVEEERTMPTAGIDLILKKINSKEYKVVEASSKGKKILKSKLFQNKVSANNRVAGKKQLSPVMPELRNLLLDAELLHDAVKWSWTGAPETWEWLKNRCLGCGICTYVCPLCYCFSTEDRCELNQKTCLKNRYWTACTLPEFARVTGGHNFHPTLKERYYNWFYHKFVRAYTEYGKSQCVACGRCQKYCPAKIDIEKALVHIVEQFKKVK